MQALSIFIPRVVVARGLDQRTVSEWQLSTATSASRDTSSVYVFGAKGGVKGSVKHVCALTSRSTHCHLAPTIPSSTPPRPTNRRKPAHFTTCTVDASGPPRTATFCGARSPTPCAKITAPSHRRRPSRWLPRCPDNAIVLSKAFGTHSAGTLSPAVGPAFAPGAHDGGATRFFGRACAGIGRPVLASTAKDFFLYLRTDLLGAAFGLSVFDSAGGIGNESQASGFSKPLSSGSASNGFKPAVFKSLETLCANPNDSLITATFVL